MPETEHKELTVQAVREEILAMVHDVPAGEPLDAVTEALIKVAVRACSTTLDLAGTKETIAEALAQGATLEQVQETLVLISGIGLHCLLACSQSVKEAAIEAGDTRYDVPLSEEQTALRDALIGDGVREKRTSAVAPGFLENVIRLTNRPTAEAIYAFRAVPWLSHETTNLQKELVGIAVDTMPSHRFLPTLRLHVENAISLGAGATAVTEVLDLAAAAPPHRGVWDKRPEAQPQAA